ncbi:MAG: hypothetical protein Ct9H300mP1_20850 [Planctomycetaceae bacterium]|nr:MAG: hypothetical protein Ct9H300mP1_20850 [Planctomycetaceae bacterium]
MPNWRPFAAGHPDIAEASRAETARLHAGDAENGRCGRSFLPPCLEVMESVYRRLGISFDLTLGESHYHQCWPVSSRVSSSKGWLPTARGAVCVFIEGNDAPFIVRKTDGAFTYATTDLATIRYRVEELDADEMLYVVDARQENIFGCCSRPPGNGGIPTSSLLTSVLAPCLAMTVDRSDAFGRHRGVGEPA